MSRYNNKSSMISHLIYQFNEQKLRKDLINFTSYTLFYNSNKVNKMQESQDINDATCLLCCEQRDIFILPKCDHKHICWSCCINMIKQGSFQCPFCKNSVHEMQKIIFVTLEQMLKHSYTDILGSSGIQLLKSQKNSNYFYSNQEVAQKIQYQTNYNCPFQQCYEIVQSLNQLKKHLNVKHKKQYCDICLNNRKCIHSQQILYSDAQYLRHIKSGQFTQHGDLTLFHPTCDFCRQTFYNIDQFRRHLQMSHEKCFICHKSSEQLKYTYFKDYEQAVQHFKKSHHYCQIGTCLATKFENVFVSEQALQQHILRVHKKSKKGDQPIMNILLGFNKTQKDEVYEWDKVGKNFISIFQMVQKHFSSLKLQLQPVDHQNINIDIRDFYNQQCKRTMHLSLNKIKQKIQDKMYDLNYKQRDLYIDDIDFFRPLEMQPVTKVELQRFLGSVFDRKIADPIISKFFHGRQDFQTSDQYFSFVKQKMKSYSKVAYYYAFPQLVRFFKSENPQKPAMDEYYYESLRDLKVKKPFIIHTKSKYSEVLSYMKNLIEKQVQERDEDSDRQSKKQLDINKYLTFLKDMNSSYYVRNQQDIFYVSKQKITNLYHMINKCKVQDFLKMNWLLKIGFSNEAYKIIYKEFYYKEEHQCINSMKKLTIQELAYLYSYSTICLQSIFQKAAFKKNKEKPLPMFTSEILGRIRPSQTHKKMREITQLQNESLKVDHLVRQNKNKGIIINKQEHPSLLDRSIFAPFKSKPPDKQDDFPSVVAFGTKRPKVWNQMLNTTTNITGNSKKNQQEYPSIMPALQKQGKKKYKKDQQQFPVFHYLGKKDKKSRMSDQATNQKKKINQVIGWAASSYMPNQWNQQATLKNWQKRQENQRRRTKRHQEIQKQLTTYQRKEQKIATEKTKIINNLIKQNQPERTQLKKDKIQPIKVPEEPMTILKSKKNNEIDVEEIKLNQTKKKNKTNKKKDLGQKKVQKCQKKKQMKLDQQCGLFEKIQKQSEIVSKKNKNDAIKNKEFIQCAQITKNEDNQKVPSKKPYQAPNLIEQFSKDQFPDLGFSNNNIKVNQLKTEPTKKIQLQFGIKIEQKNKQKSKRRKMRADDTSSQQQTNTQLKKQQQFKTISDKYQKAVQQKLSKVNQIIKTANAQQKPQNVIKIKKGKNGKSTIIQRVNLNSFW